MRRRFMTAVAVLAVAFAPAFAAEETVKQKPAEDQQAQKPAPKADAAKPADPAQPAPAAECTPAATRVNTLEDLFGTRDWSALLARSAGPVAGETVLWRDATAQAAPATAPKAAAPEAAATSKAEPSK